MTKHCDKADKSCQGCYKSDTCDKYLQFRAGRKSAFEDAIKKCGQLMAEKNLNLAMYDMQDWLWSKQNEVD